MGHRTAVTCGKWGLTFRSERTEGNTGMQNRLPGSKVSHQLDADDKCIPLTSGHLKRLFPEMNDHSKSMVLKSSQLGGFGISKMFASMVEERSTCISQGAHA